MGRPSQLAFDDDATPLVLGFLAAFRPILSRLLSHSYQLPAECVVGAVSYTHLRAHETRGNLVCRLLLEKKK